MLNARKNLVIFRVPMVVTKVRGLVEICRFGVTCCLNLPGSSMQRVPPKLW